LPTTRRALQIKPGYAHAEYNLAGLLAKLPGRQEEAVAHYEEAIRLEPDFPDAHYNLANLLSGMRGHSATRPFSGV
jgi:tetratricopeptide (TPR) repeat protein